VLPGLYIYKKEVDWSALHEGLAIPVTKHGLFYDKMNLKLNHGEHRSIKLPENEREYMAFYSTDFDDTFAVDCITHSEIVETRKIVRIIPELEIEQLLQSDKTASLLEKVQTVKIRRLDRTIGESLKWLYDNRCQICDLAVGEKYNATIIHTHHIEYFSRSLNNDASNIMVICPNHHGIIHAVNPTFNYDRLSFTYPNGLVECLKLNRHL